MKALHSMTLTPVRPFTNYEIQNIAYYYHVWGETTTRYAVRINAKSLGILYNRYGNWETMIPTPYTNGWFRMMEYANQHTMQEMHAIVEQVTFERLQGAGD